MEYSVLWDNLAQLGAALGLPWEQCFHFSSYLKWNFWKWIILYAKGCMGHKVTWSHVIYNHPVSCTRHQRLVLWEWIECVAVLLPAMELCYCTVQLRYTLPALLVWIVCMHVSVIWFYLNVTITKLIITRWLISKLL